MIRAYGEILLHHYRVVNGYISAKVLWGVIPLDFLMHFLVGAIYTIIGIKLKIRLRTTLISLIVLTLIKEYHDSFVIGSNMAEHLKDIAASLVFIFAVLIFRLVKKHRSSM